MVALRYRRDMARTKHSRRRVPPCLLRATDSAAPALTLTTDTDDLGCCFRLRLQKPEASTMESPDDAFAACGRPKQSGDRRRSWRLCHVRLPDHSRTVCGVNCISDSNRYIYPGRAGGRISLGLRIARLG